MATFDKQQFFWHSQGMKKQSLAIVIPAYNEEKTIFQVIKSLPKNLPGISRIDVVVVDDGSRDRTGILARRAGALVLRHEINLGYGASCITGLKKALLDKYDLTITLDADGQHDPREIINFIKEYEKTKSDFIAGTRLKHDRKKTMPLVRVAGNKFFGGLIYLFSGHTPSDSQSGFRLFSKKALKVASQIYGEGYEFTTELYVKIYNSHLKTKEIPIKTIYIKDKKSGQNIINGINIMIRMFVNHLLG